MPDDASGMPEGDRPAVRVHPGVVVGDAEVVEEGEHLHGERLVDLDQADVVDREAGARQGALGGRDRADAHQRRVDAGEGVADHAHLRRQAELVGHGCGRDQCSGRAVVEAGGVAGGDVAVRAERRPQLGECLGGGAGTRWLVGRGQVPATSLGPHRDRHEVGLDGAGGVGVGHLLLAGGGEGIGAFAGELREAVVQVLGGLAHDERVGVDESFGHEARVRVDALADRVPAHVLDATGETDVDGSGCDPGRQSGDCRHGAGAHAVDRVAGHRLRQPGEQTGAASEGQALVADLGGRRDGDLVDPLRRQGGVAAQQLADDLDDEVVGPGVGVPAAGLAERGAHAVDEDDVAGHADGRADHRTSR